MSIVEFLSINLRLAWTPWFHRKKLSIPYIINLIIKAPHVGRALESLRTFITRFWFQERIFEGTNDVFFRTYFDTLVETWKRNTPWHLLRTTFFSIGGWYYFGDSAQVLHRINLCNCNAFCWKKSWFFNPNRVKEESEVFCLFYFFWKASTRLFFTHSCL